jgi:hypothetical protein
MNEPIKAGDMCEVITGLGGPQSPNVGKRVRVTDLQGEHSRHGRVWRCKGDGIVQLNEVGDYMVTNWADFPAAWLRKLPPAEPHAANDETKIELAA